MDRHVHHGIRMIHTRNGHLSCLCCKRAPQTTTQRTHWRRAHGKAWLSTGQAWKHALLHSYLPYTWRLPSLPQSDGVGHQEVVSFPRYIHGLCSISFFHLWSKDTTLIHVQINHKLVISNINPNTVAAIIRCTNSLPPTCFAHSPMQMRMRTMSCTPL
jgi:hypothetical protein